MANWAEIDENNIVLRVVVTRNDDPNGDEGYKWLVDNLGGRWIQTSYNNSGGVHYLPSHIRDENNNRIPSGRPNMRYNLASVGGTYDEARDAFIPKKPNGDGWVLNETTCLWDYLD